jgi:thioredoxin reductase
MYIPEVRWNGILSVNEKMKTGVCGIYGAGECTTRASTIIGAMASGLIAAITRLGEENDQNKKVV